MKRQTTTKQSRKKNKNKVKVVKKESFSALYILQLLPR